MTSHHASPLRELLRETTRSLKVYQVGGREYTDLEDALRAAADIRLPNITAKLKMEHYHGAISVALADRPFLLFLASLTEGRSLAAPPPPTKEPTP